VTGELDAEPHEGGAFGGPVADASGRVAGGGVDRLSLGLAVDVEMAVEHGREPDGVGLPTVGRRVARDAGQRRQFGVQPGQRVVTLGDRRRRGDGRGNDRAALALTGMQRLGGLGRRRQVVVEQPGHRGATLHFGLHLAGDVAGVGPQQVVHRVPAGGGALYEVGPGQHVEQDGGIVQRRIRQRRRRVRADVGRGM
jgi:hypothetical protein